MDESARKLNHKYEARLYGFKAETNPYVLLYEEMQWRAGHVQMLRERIADLPDEALFVELENGQMVEGALLKRYDVERNMLDRVVNRIIDAGIAERYVNLAEMEAGKFVEALNIAFDDPKVGLTRHQRRSLGQAIESVFGNLAEATANPQALDVRSAQDVAHDPVVQRPDVDN